MIIPGPVLLIPILFITSKCHTAKNNSDVIISYTSHSEAESSRNVSNTKTERIDTNVTNDYNNFMHLIYPENDEITEKVTDEKRTTENDIVFIPNENQREVIRNEEYLLRNPIRLDDIMKSDGDNVVQDTEAPKDIIFVNGKNNEHEETITPTTEREKTKRVKETKHIVLNCTNLDCDSTVKSICGAKIEHKQWKYRLFLNECYFRKVNCNFKKSENRYQKVALNKCENIGTHASETPLMYSYVPRYYVKEKPKPSQAEKLVKLNNTRRILSRRSLTTSLNGRYCDHLCPISCPEDYDPECAISSTGQRKVFVNHCKMDYNSCTFNIVWHRRPLSECVGGKKADMRQNRGFINWMQSVGIVDNKGRLVLS